MRAHRQTILESVIDRGRSTPEVCWEYTGAKLRDGYGTVTRNSVQMRAHRAAYELLVGPIPDGFELDHLCRNRVCVNPAHLEPVPQRVNWERSFAPSRLAALATACSRGHAWTPENTRIATARGKSYRVCRTCASARGKSPEAQAYLAQWRVANKEMLRAKRAEYYRRNRESKLAYAAARRERARAEQRAA